MKESTRTALMLLFIVLIGVAFFGMYQYNEARNEAVAELEAKGFVCQKNPLGMYKECLSPEYVENYGINFTLNWNVSGEQNG